MRVAAVFVIASLSLVAACTPTVTPTGTPSDRPMATPTGMPSSVGPSTTDTPTPTSTATTRAVTWTLQSTDGDVPDARSGHTWTADPSDAAAYLVGGRVAGTPVMDVWRYDLGADRWVARDPDGSMPAARSGHAAVWNDDLGVIVFGGELAGGTTAADLWAYDPQANAWREIPPVALHPVGRTGACAAVGPDDRIWIDGGRAADGTPMSELWVVDPLTGAWTQVDTTGSGPAARAGHACWWTPDGRFIVTGGSARDDVFGDVWALDGAEDGSVDGDLTWTRIAAETTAEPRSDAAWSRVSDRIVLVGGRDGFGSALDDVAAFDDLDATTEVFGTIGAAPAARISGALVDDPAGERSLLFGGLVGATASDELWRLQLP